MRRNLVIAVGLLLLVSLLARLSAPRKPEWEPSWREEISFVLDEDSSYYSEHLDIENDAYKIRSHGCTGGGISERGFVRYDNGQLELWSEKGETTTFAVTRQESGWRLDNPKKVYFPNPYTVPHLHPDRDWFREGEPLELEGLRLGMPRAEVEKRFPWHTIQDGALICFDRPRRKFAVTFDQQSRVCRITGYRLSQSGRSLLNERSTQADAEALLGRLDWRPGKWDSLQSSHGPLRIESIQDQGERPGESCLWRLTLQI